MATYTILSYIVIFIAVMRNKKLKKCNEHNRICIIFTTIIILVVIVASFFSKGIHLGLCMSDVVFFSDWSILATVTLPFIVFGIYILIILIQSSSIRHKIASVDNEVKADYAEIQEEIKNMRGYVNQEKRESALNVEMDVLDE